MCQTTISGFDDMDEISSTSRKKTGKLIEPRKIRKPLMEKKRRARINQSLDELKRIVVDAEKLAGQDLSRVNKLEKADILEMTVRYLKRTATLPSPCEPDVYLAGYRQCIGQVQELMAEQWSDERRQQSGRRMVEHLEGCVRRLAVPPKRRLSTGSWSSSSDESIRPPILETIAQRHHTAVCWPADLERNGASSDDDSVQEGDEPKATTVLTTNDRPTSDHTTEIQDVTPKSMWRPW